MAACKAAGKAAAVVGTVALGGASALRTKVAVHHCGATWPAARAAALAAWAMRAAKASQWVASPWAVALLVWAVGGASHSSSQHGALGVGAAGLAWAAAVVLSDGMRWSWLTVQVAVALAGSGAAGTAVATAVAEGLNLGENSRMTCPGSEAVGALAGAAEGWGERVSTHTDTADAAGTATAGAVVNGSTGGAARSGAELGTALGAATGAAALRAAALAGGVIRYTPIACSMLRRRALKRSRKGWVGATREAAFMQGLGKRKTTR